MRSRVHAGGTKTIALGSQGLTVTVEGLGAMGMSAFYGARDDEESAATLNRTLDLGITLIDTAESYGPFLNEQLIAKAIGNRRAEFTLATKFGFELSDDGDRGPVNGSPAYARKALERSLKHLETDHIDLYFFTVAQKHKDNIQVGDKDDDGDEGRELVPVGATV